MRILFVFLFLSAGHYGFAQLDSLLNELKNPGTDSNKVDLLREASNIYLETNLDSSRLLAEQGLALSESIGHIQGQIHHSNLLGNYYQRTSSHDTAMFYYDRVMKLSDESGYIKGKAIGLNNIAILYNYQGEYPKALELYQEALDYEFMLGDTTGIAQAYNNIGVIHYYMGNLDKTLEYFELSIAMSEAVNDESVLKKGYNNLGALYDYAKDYNGALRQYEKALVLAEKTGEKKEIGLFINNIATAHSGLNNHATALQYYERALVLRREMNDEAGLATTYLNMAGSYFDLGRFKSSEEHISTALELSLEHDLKFVRSEVYKKVQGFRKEQRRYEEALIYAEKYRALKDTILNEERISAVTEMETKYESEQKERLLLEEQSKNDKLAKEKIEAELAVNNRNNALRLTGVGVLSLIFFGLYVMQRNKRNAEAERNLAVIRERDKGLQAVISAQEEERSRISKDLHDGVGQQLSGLKMGFQVLKKELDSGNGEVNEHIDKLSSVLDESASDVRTISHQMMPKALAEVGLGPVMKDMLEKSLGTGGLSYRFDEPRPVGRMDPAVELSLYRIAQEAVNNIIKHAQAKHVDIQLYKTKKQVIMSIEDDGVGFEHTSSGSGHGMLNIENRCRMMEGQLEVESSPGKGTTLRLRVPVNERSQ